MEPSKKIRDSFKLTVEHSNLPYLLVSKKEFDLELVSYSPKVASLVKDIQDFYKTGAFASYINNISNLDIGKSLSDIVLYKGDQLELYGEEIDNDLFLVQVNNNKGYLDKKPSTPASGLAASFNSSEVTRTIYELRSSIKEASFYIDNLKRELESNHQKVNQVEGKLEQVENKLILELKESSSILKNKVEILEGKLSELKETITSLKNNSLLKFTSDLTFKKMVGIAVALISLLSSMGVFNGIISNSFEESSELDDKIEKLLELTDD